MCKGQGLAILPLAFNMASTATFLRLVSMPCYGVWCMIVQGVHKDNVGMHGASLAPFVTSHTLVTKNCATAAHTLFN